MIRRFENKDLDQVMSIWLQVNMESHSFIGADYWKDNYEMVREMIPKAEVLVSEENGQIRGFIGLIDTYIAGIFVRAAEQLHMARPNGRFCGAKRPKCEAEQPLGFD